MVTLVAVLVLVPRGEAADALRRVLDHRAHVLQQVEREDVWYHDLRAPLGDLRPTPGAAPFREFIVLVWCADFHTSKFSTPADNDSGGVASAERGRGGGQRSRRAAEPPAPPRCAPRPRRVAPLRGAADSLLVAPRGVAALAAAPCRRGS
jgi:hypothetical protein